MQIERMKAWCYKVMPLVYEDSLSYYEFLCKMLAKLNEVIDVTNSTKEEVENLLTAFRAEIENYFNERVNGINEQIDNLNAEIDEKTNNIGEYNADVAMGFSAYNQPKIRGQFIGYADELNYRESYFNLVGGKAFTINEMHSLMMRDSGGKFVRGDVDSITIFNANMITRDTVGSGWYRGVLCYCDDELVHLSGSINTGSASIKLYDGSIGAGMYTFRFEMTEPNAYVTPRIRITPQGGTPSYPNVPSSGVFTFQASGLTNVYLYFDVREGFQFNNIGIHCCLINNTYGDNANSLVPSKTYTPNKPNNYGYNHNDRYNGIYVNEGSVYSTCFVKPYDPNEVITGGMINDGTLTIYDITYRVTPFDVGIPKYYKYGAGVYLVVRHKGDVVINYPAFT